MIEDIRGNAKITFKDTFDWSVSSRYGLKLAFIVGVALGTYFFVKEYFSRGMSLIPALVIALIVCFVVLFVSTILNFLILFFSHLRLSKDQLNIKWKIDEKTLELSDSSGNVIVTPWQQVKKIEAKKNGLLIHQKPNCSRWIPNRVFTPEQRRKLIEFSTRLCS